MADLKIFNWYRTDDNGVVHLAFYTLQDYSAKNSIKTLCDQFIGRSQHTIDAGMNPVNKCKECTTALLRLKEILYEIQ